MIRALILAAMGRPTESIEVNDLQHRELERMINAPTSPQRLVLRARIVLSRTEGLSQEATVVELGVSRPTVIRWERRFAALGVQGLIKDAPGRGPKPSILDYLPARKNRPYRSVKSLFISQNTAEPDFWTKTTRF